MIIKRFSVVTALILIALLIGCSATEVELLETTTPASTPTEEGLVTLVGSFTYSVADYGGSVLWEFIPLECHSYVVDWDLIDDLPIEASPSNRVELVARHKEYIIVEIISITILEEH